ncbi:MAG TPA: MipA/OmpV family protein [Gammaproteobacteria bacterium]|jgi:outer membrane scaffolding protein for murein synthesis (MipA/OmpV family)|nr:MipA/OmpV family protein [Gammaproteobacteria bacterium]
MGQAQSLWRLMLLVLSGVWLPQLGNAVDNTPDNAASSKPPAFTLERKPVWEIGLGGGYSGGFDYPASSERNQRTLFLPYAIYRGPTFRVGSGRVQAVAVEDPRFKLDLSVGASFNADSDGNSARSGMPDLDFLFEVGPRLEYRVFDWPIGDNSRSTLSWENYIRAVFSTDFTRVDTRGVRLGSRLRYQYTDIGGKPIDFFARLGPIWGSADLQDYFYQVDPAFATDTRAAFKAGGGYLGSELFYGIRFWATRHFRLIAGSTLGFYDGAANEDSPLFEQRRSTSYALVVIWSIWQSPNAIEVFQED